VLNKGTQHSLSKHVQTAPEGAYTKCPGHNVQGMPVCQRVWIAMPLLDPGVFSPVVCFCRKFSVGTWLRVVMATHSHRSTVYTATMRIVPFASSSNTTREGFTASGLFSPRPPHSNSVNVSNLGSPAPQNGLTGQTRERYCDSIDHLSFPHAMPLSVEASPLVPFRSRYPDYRRFQRKNQPKHPSRFSSFHRPPFISCYMTVCCKTSAPSMSV